MSDVLKDYPIFLDGRVPSKEDLASLAFAGFAHFTAMQIRGGKVKGLDLHLERLDRASLAMFGKGVSQDRLLFALQNAAAEGPEDMSLMLTVFSRNGEFVTTGMNDELRILIRSDAPSDGPAAPLRLMPVRHERYLPQVKQVGEGAKTLYVQRAARDGFDDAVFLDSSGRLSEATIWNIAFWDGEAVVWPEAEMLLGTTMAIVQRQLRKSGVPQRTQAIRLQDITKFSGAAVMNSWSPGIAVTAIGDIRISDAPDFQALLHYAWQSETPTKFGFDAKE